MLISTRGGSVRQNGGRSFTKKHAHCLHPSEKNGFIYFPLLWCSTKNIMDNCAETTSLSLQPLYSDGSWNINWFINCRSSGFTFWVHVWTTSWSPLNMGISVHPKSFSIFVVAIIHLNCIMNHSSWLHIYTITISRSTFLLYHHVYVLLENIISLLNY